MKKYFDGVLLLVKCSIKKTILRIIHITPMTAFEKCAAKYLLALSSFPFAWSFFSSKSTSIVPNSGTDRLVFPPFENEQ